MKLITSCRCSPVTGLNKIKCAKISLGEGLSLTAPLWMCLIDKNSRFDIHNFASGIPGVATLNFFNVRPRSAANASPSILTKTTYLGASLNTTINRSRIILLVLNVYVCTNEYLL